jgi:hypothetical protein
VLGDRLLLVEALERAVVPLVQPPVTPDRQPRPVGGVEGELGGADRPGQQRRVDHPEVDPRLLGQEPAGGGGLPLALLGEGDVGPPGEEVQLVPGGLSMAEEDQVGHGGERILAPRGPA